MKIFLMNIRTLSDAEAEKAYLMLDDEKRARVSRMHRDDALRSIAADILARRGISAACGIPPEEIQFSYNAHAKPSVESADIRFSLSHSADYAVCAISENDVGVDIELMRPFRGAIAERVYSESERAYMISDPSLAQRRFFELWTLKEAYSKCRGLSFLSCAREISFDLTGRGIVPSIGGYRFEVDCSCDGYAIAACESISGVEGNQIK